MKVKISSKKGIMGPVISVFVMLLLISILAGLTFLFVSGLKTNVVSTTATTGSTITNESGGWINATAYPLAGASSLGATSFSVAATNTTFGPLDHISAGNYTVNGSGWVTGTSGRSYDYGSVNFTYSYKYIPTESGNAYTSVHDTESAGATIVGYLPLIFLAVVFGAILTLVLRIILPYINFGKNLGGF